MIARNVSIILVIIGSMIMQYIDFVRFFPAQLRGQVVDARTGNPISKAHVFLIQGEEEDFTGVQGEFKLRTSTSFPLRIAVECPGYLATTYDCQSEKHPVQIKLQPVR
jgi:hypothetical protein